MIEEAEVTTAGVFKCEKCNKVCRTKQGLSRHKNTKHSTVPLMDKKSAEEILPPELLRKYINESAIKLSRDGCYSEAIQSAFSGFNFSLDDTV